MYLLDSGQCLPNTLNSINDPRVQVFHNRIVNRPSQAFRRDPIRQNLFRNG